MVAALTRPDQVISSRYVKVMRVRHCAPSGSSSTCSGPLEGYLLKHARVLARKVASGAVMLADDWNTFPEMHLSDLSHPPVRKEEL